VSPDELVVFDLETTGINPRTDRVLEIGAVIYKKSDYRATGQVTTFQCFIRQTKPIPADATKINKITDDMVRDGLSEFEALENFFEFVGERQLCAYNSEFDVAFINHMGKRSGYASHSIVDPSDVIDIYTFIRQKWIIKPNYKLSNVAKKLGINTGASHRAVADSTTALAAYIKVIQLAASTEKAYRIRQEEFNRELRLKYSPEAINSLDDQEIPKSKNQSPSIRWGYIFLAVLFLLVIIFGR
jgi:DNA polymerase III epsilon subunit family exonuclease